MMEGMSALEIVEVGPRDGLQNEDAVLDVVVAAGDPWSHLVSKGQTLRIVDLEGNQAVDTLFYVAAYTSERYSAPETIRAQGFTCSVNTPYTGGELNRRYGKADGTQESVMIEINKKKFVDIASFKKTEGFDAIQGVARAVLQAVAQRARERVS